MPVNLAENQACQGHFFNNASGKTMTMHYLRTLP